MRRAGYVTPTHCLRSDFADKGAFRFADTTRRIDLFIYRLIFRPFSSTFATSMPSLYSSFLLSKLLSPYPKIIGLPRFDNKVMPDLN